MTNITKLNVFIFLSSFIRGMVEYFIPIFLINKHFSLKEVFLFFVLHYLFMILLHIPFLKLAQKIKFKWLLIINCLFFILNYYYLTNLNSSILNLILSSFIFSLYFFTYWIGRNYYTVALLNKNNLGKEIGYLIIFTQLALIPSTYLGALLIENTPLWLTILIIGVLAIISIMPLFKLNNDEKKEDIATFKNIKKISIAKTLYMILDQFRMIAIYLFPLYLYQNIKNSYSFIGLFNIIIGVATIIFIFIFSKRLDKTKKDYITITIILLCITWIFKLNIKTFIWVLVIAFFEGILSKSTENTISKKIFDTASLTGNLNFVSVYMFLQNISRFLIFLVSYFFIRELKILLYVCIIGSFLVCIISRITKYKHSI